MRAMKISGARRRWEAAHGSDDVLRADADFEAWVDARLEASIQAQDDAELVARLWGPEPEFMLPANNNEEG